MAYFPMYTDISKKRCIIYGGGKVAFRKVKVLQDFDADVIVIASEIDDAISENSKVTCVYSEFESDQLDRENPFLVIAATSDEKINSCISQECKQRNIPVNVVDCPEECTFIFPAYIKSKEVVAAFSSGGKSPVLAQYLKKEMAKILTPDMGMIADQMAVFRDEVKQRLCREDVKKELYEKILYGYFENGQFPNEEEFEKLLMVYQEKEGKAC